MFPVPMCHVSQADGGILLLDSFAALNTVFELDVTLADCYPGTGQTLSNLIESPNDGESQTTYDKTLGNNLSVDSTDPAFVGSAGDPAAYLDCDGGDVCAQIAAMTAFQKSLHKTSGAGSGVWWHAMAFQYQFGAGAFQLFWGTNDIATTQGVSAGSNVRTTMRLEISRGNFQTVNFTVPSMSDGDDVLLVMSGDPTDTDDLRIWIKSATKLTDPDMNSATSTTDSPGNAIWGGGRAQASSVSVNPNTRLYSEAMGQAFLDDPEFANILSTWDARHERNYVP